MVSVAFRDTDLWVGLGNASHAVPSLNRNIALPSHELILADIPVPDCHFQHHR